MRLVLDTNVVASAVLWGGVPRRLLYDSREKRVSLFFNQVLACAMAARADLIVSGDRRHLLPLSSFEGMPIVSPAEALRLISA